MCVSGDPIEDGSALVQVMACGKTDDKALPESVMIYFADENMRHRKRTTIYNYSSTQVARFNTQMLSYQYIPDSKVHGANIGPVWGQQDPDGPHVGPMNFAIWDDIPLSR